MDLGIKDKVAVVTGAAFKGGLGWTIATALAREGVNIAVADVIFEGIQALAEELKGIGRKAIALEVDQSIYDEVKQAVAKINEELGPIDILINNAALMGNIALVRKMKPSAWDKEIAINLNGPFYWTREVLPSMIERGWGRIVNISSVAGTRGQLALPSYSASKGGLITFTKVVAYEGGSRGVTANVVTLGIIDTGVYERDIEKGITKREAVDALVKEVPIGRMGKPSEVAGVVTFLVSETASYVNGANIVIAGGIPA